MTDEHVVLSERPEDQLKAVEWAREQKKKILDDKSRRIADALMEKMTPLILKNSAQKQCWVQFGYSSFENTLTRHKTVSK